MVPTDKDKDEEEYDDESEPEGEGWELDPNDPSSSDFDLSEAGYYGVEPERRPFYVSRVLMLIITILLLVAFLGPTCVRLFS